MFGVTSERWSRGHILIEIFSGMWARRSKNRNPANKIKKRQRHKSEPIYHNTYIPIVTSERRQSAPHIRQDMSGPSSQKVVIRPSILISQRAQGVLYGQCELQTWWAWSWVRRVLQRTWFPHYRLFRSWANYGWYCGGGVSDTGGVWLAWGKIISINR